MFFASIFSYAQRKRLCAAAYRKTRQNLAERTATLLPQLAQHGITLADGSNRRPGPQDHRRADGPAPAQRRARAAPMACGSRRATSRTRSTIWSAGWPGLASTVRTPGAPFRSPQPAMAEKKRPRRTRERILETSLALFNRFGRAAGHHRGHRRRDEHQSGQPLLPFPATRTRSSSSSTRRTRRGCCRSTPIPAGAALDVDDLWLWLHLLFERMWEYRFLYRDLDELASRDRKLGTRIGALLRKGAATVIELCRGMVAAGNDARVGPRDRSAGRQRRCSSRRTGRRTTGFAGRAHDDASDVDAGRAAYQVLALFGPYLDGDARAHLDRLSADYL